MNEVYRYSKLDDRADWVNGDGDVASSAYEIDIGYDQYDVMANELADAQDAHDAETREIALKNNIPYVCGVIAVRDVLAEPDAMDRTAYEDAVDAIYKVHAYGNQLKGMRQQRQILGSDFNKRYRNPARVLSGAEAKYLDLRQTARQAELDLTEDDPDDYVSLERIAMRRAIIKAGKKTRKREVEEN